MYSAQFVGWTMSGLDASLWNFSSETISFEVFSQITTNCIQHRYLHLYLATPLLDILVDTFAWILSLRASIVLVVYGGGFINIILFYKLAKKWPQLIKSWSDSKIDFSISEKQPEAINNALRRKMNVVFVVGITTAITE